MKSLIHLARRLLAKQPSLRRKIVNTLYRVPFLDMYLRETLHRQDETQWRRLDPDDLPEDIRRLCTQLRFRMERR